MQVGLGWRMRGWAPARLKFRRDSAEQPAKVDRGKSEASRKGEIQADFRAHQPAKTNKRESERSACARPSARTHTHTHSLHQNTLGRLRSCARRRPFVALLSPSRRPLLPALAQSAQLTCWPLVEFPSSQKKQECWSTTNAMTTANSYYTGSLPRLGQRRPAKEANSNSLARAASVRAWNQPDSVSVAPASLHRHSHQPQGPGRPKFSTLTPAEAQAHAKRLRANLRAPSRTASVLHKPRAPPMLVDDRPAPPVSSPSPARHSLDLPDCAPPSALQTMSLDLGEAARSLTSYTGSPRGPIAFLKLAGAHNQASLKQRQASRTSLSSSTSKVIQNFKRLFQRQTSAPSSRQAQARSISPSADSLSYSSFQTSPHSLASSISQTCLNRSQSPATTCLPPPPSCDLKSMNYMQSNGALSESVNYSNYDDFTRVRNEQTNNLLHLHKPTGQQSSDLYSNLSHIDDDTNSWHLSSLPIAFEGNLTTVFEEQANHSGRQRAPAGLPNPPEPHNTNFRSVSSASRNEPANHGNCRISSPSQSMSSIATIDSVLDSSACNKQLLNSRRTSFRFSYTQPVVYDQQVRSDHNPNQREHLHGQQPLPECPPMCSHSNLTCPLLLFSQKNSGLPPKFPTSGELKYTCNSTGGSSRNSSVTNSGANSGSGSSSNSEQISPGAKSLLSSDRASVSTADDELTLDQKLAELHYDNSRLHDIGDDTTLDGDTTIISDTSTIRGDSAADNTAALYQDKCAQLERTVESLKNKIISKEKELTDMQLKLWSSDYQTDQLKASISRLEKENAQLKATVLASSNRGNTTLAANRTALKG